jgi:ABC-type transport system involved in multi-copper enzyme maturation permease subunit
VIIGPVFSRETQTAPRRPRHFLFRAIYVLTLLIIVCTAWLFVAGTQVIRNVGDMARFGAIVFQILAPLQLAMLTFLAAFGVTSAVSQEKDRHTLILLLMTRLSNSELVLGKLMSALLEVLVLLVASFPLFMLITLLGGVSYGQVVRVFAVTLTTLVAAGSLGSMFALWREKTFQALSLTALSIAIWIGLCQSIYAGWLFDGTWGDWTCQSLATACSPVLAVVAAAQPLAFTPEHASDAVAWYVALSIVAAAAMNLWSILRVRAWNPSREVRPLQQEQTWQRSIWGEEHDATTGAAAKDSEPGAPNGGTAAEAAAAHAAHEDATSRNQERDRALHIDSYRWKAPRASRQVWNNPILWREVCTRAYGRKLLIIQLSYVLTWCMVAAALYWILAAAPTPARARAAGNIIPPAAQPLAPFFLVSLVVINALAVNSITNERDGQALDLLLVSDVSPVEFVLGKLGGVLWVTKLMVLGPMLLAFYLWWAGGITLENLIYLLLGLTVMIIFAASLGIHCGMNYASSRSAIGTSLGTVFFLFVGVVTCLIIMVSFSGSFQVQYAPFIAFILGGSIGLYVALGNRNPSAAIGFAAAGLPISTFIALVSFVLGHRELSICSLVLVAYGFTTAAMLVPAISEFDIAMGRTKSGPEE